MIRSTVVTCPYSTGQQIYFVLGRKSDFLLLMLLGVVVLLFVCLLVCCCASLNGYDFGVAIVVVFVLTS